jgi:ATP-dependent Clp protease ATP-binding subunit ClpB
MPVHVFAAMLSDTANRTTRLLKHMGADVDQLITLLDKEMAQLPEVSPFSGDVQAGPELMRWLNIAEKLRHEAGATSISIDTLLLALPSADPNLSRVLSAAGIKPEALARAVTASVGGADQGDNESERQALEQFTLDLTELARNGKLDPVIGRDSEIRRTIQVLQRRTKNNPVLIGAPGVGKTAIVEGLALRITNGEVPEGLKSKTILSLDLAALVAGAKFRGEFEERLKTVLNALAKRSNDVVLFIDELHTVVGAGGAEGSLDASNMLKPALARGDLHCLGATTLDEYRQYIESDKALERRFQRVQIQEPEPDDAIAILRGLKERYELHHGVAITDPAIVQAVTLSRRYITDRQLPDKAIDLIDEAASSIRMEIDSKPEEMDQLDRKLVQLKIEQEALSKEEDEQSKQRLAALAAEIERAESDFRSLESIWLIEKAAQQEAQELKEALDQARQAMEVARRASDFSTMSELQYGRIPELEKKITAEAQTPKLNSKLFRHQVTEEEVAEVVAKWTGIPVQKMLASDKDKLLALEAQIGQRVVGQTEAVTLVAQAIRRARAGLADPNRPNGSFLFLGPTGVGKTELSKVLAEQLFDSDQSLIRIDMSEYMEKHAVARLIGAPPGYIGHEEGGYLTEQVRRRPYAVILLDEVEKAHPDVFNLLLQVLDEGRLTDSQGRTVDFKNTIVIMTSNLGSELIQQLSSSQSEDELKDRVMEQVKQAFRPEFFNRIDDCVMFKPLTEANIETIAALQIDSLLDRLSEQHLQLTIDDEVMRNLASAGYDPLYGARPLKRLIQRMLENPLADAILSGEVSASHRVHVEMSDTGLKFKSV